MAEATSGDVKKVGVEEANPRRPLFIVTKGNSYAGARDSGEKVRRQSLTGFDSFDNCGRFIK